VKRTQILYIHPHGHLVSDKIIPSGAITALNSIPGGKLGLYSYEIDRAVLKAARAILIDVHWPFAMPAAKRIIECSKNVNPDAQIIIGGYTAGIFPMNILETTAADHVIIHDSEVCAARLVKNIISGEKLPIIPNVLSRDGTRGPIEDLSSGMFDNLDFIDATWFPSHWNSETMKVCLLLTRGCCLEPGRRSALPKKRCILKRTHTGAVLLRSPKALENDMLRLQDMSRQRQIVCDIYAGQAPEEYISECFEIINRRWNFRISFYACNTLCEQMFSLSERCEAEDDFDCWLSLICLDNPDIAPGGLLRREQACGLAEKLSEAGIIGSKEVPPPFPEVVSISSRFGLKCNRNPINWTIPPQRIKFETDKEEFLYNYRLSCMSNKLAFLKFLSPGIYEHYGFSRDPIFELPGIIATGTECFHNSVLRGIQEWGTPIPENIEFLAWPVASKTNFDDVAWYYATARSLAIPKDAEPFGTVFSTTARGWSLKVLLPDSSDARMKDRQLISALIFLPKGMEAIVGIDSGLTLLTVLIPPGTIVHDLKEINLFASEDSLNVVYGPNQGTENEDSIFRQT
jgi:hypothetical protein